MSETVAEFKEERRKVMEYAVRLHCRKKHGSGDLCEACADLITYASSRIDVCPNNYTTIPCNRCIHPCYSPEMRERMREVSVSARTYMLMHPAVKFRYGLL